MIIDKASLI